MPMHRVDAAATFRRPLTSEERSEIEGRLCALVHDAPQVAPVVAWADDGSAVIRSMLLQGADADDASRRATSLIDGIVRGALAERAEKDAYVGSIVVWVGRPPD